MLVHVPFDGWTDKLLEATQQDLGLSAEAMANMFPRGAISAVEAFVALSDQDMIRRFAEYEVRPEGVTATIKSLILIRLEGAAPHRRPFPALYKCWQDRNMHPSLCIPFTGPLIVCGGLQVTGPLILISIQSGHYWLAYMAQRLLTGLLIRG